jgi:group I intron endonuclease
MQTQSCSVYRATSPSGKRYYGVSQEVEKRWWKHEWDAKKGAKRPLAKAIAKYGFAAMNFEVLFTEIGNDAHKKCLDAEMLLIEMDNTMMPNGYNVTAGGEGASGVKIPKEATAKQIASCKRTKSLWSEEKKAEVKVNRERSQNKPEVAEKRRVLLKARWEDPAEVAKMLTRKEDTSALSAAAKKRWLTRDKTAIKELNSRQVICVETGKTFPSVCSARDWLRENGWPKAVHGGIASVARGEGKKSYGYTWKYV